MRSILAFLPDVSGKAGRTAIVSFSALVAVAVPALSILSASRDVGEISIAVRTADVAAIQETFCAFAIERLEGDASTSYVAARPNGDTVVMFFDEEHPGSIRCEFETAGGNTAIRLSAVMFDARFIAPSAVDAINGAFRGRQAAPSG